MKRFVYSMVVTVGLLLMAPLATSAEPTPGVTYIAGTVTYSNHTTPVVGASVVVTCNGFTADSNTTSAGGYLVQFTSSQCPDSSTAGVAASKGSAGGSSRGTVNGLTTDVNLALVNVSLVPELGLVTGFGAITLGGGAFLLIRRRNLSGSRG